MNSVFKQLIFSHMTENYWNYSFQYRKLNTDCRGKKRDSPEEIKPSKNFVTLFFHQANFRSASLQRKIFREIHFFKQAVRCRNPTRDGWLRSANATSVLSSHPSFLLRHLKSDWRAEKNRTSASNEKGSIRWVCPRLTCFSLQTLKCVRAERKWKKMVIKHFGKNVPWTRVERFREDSDGKIDGEHSFKASTSLRKHDSKRK